MDWRIPFVTFMGTTTLWFSFFSIGILSIYLKGPLVLNSLFYVSAFSARPLGALFFGRLGDLLGRKVSINLVFFLLFLGDLLVVLRIYVVSPFLIGLALGGWSSFSVFLAESVDQMRGSWTSLVQLSVPAGLLLSLGVAITPLTLLFPSLMSALLSIISISLPEPTRFRTGLERHGVKALLKGVGIKAGESSNFYLFTSFSIPFLLKAGLKVGLFPILVLSVEELILMIPIGVLSDLVGKSKVMRGGTILMFSSVLVLIVSALLKDFALTMLSFLVFGLGDTLSYAPQAAYLAELYKPEHRVTMVGLAYQISALLSGGMTVLLTSLSLSLLGERMTFIALPLISFVFSMISMLSI
ncbi:MAG: MFS transporter [Metallosphaera sp.]|uniref:MFS transporter n=2 Tax=Metallosphaera sp. TaxID=2020860 RepID=UPI0031825C74